MNITFTGDCIPAALHLLFNTSLNNCDPVLTQSGEALTVTLPDDWSWSSGERNVLVPLLASLGIPDREPERLFLANLKTLDVKTAAVCVESITISAGFGDCVAPLAAAI